MLNDIENNLIIDFNIDYNLLFHILTLNFINYIWSNITYFLTQFKNTLKSNQGLRVCFISLFIATILTVYEILLFYAFVIPEINKEVNEGLILLSFQIKQQINNNININYDYFKNVDIIDNNYSSYYEQNPDGMAAKAELELAKKRLKKWYTKFPNAYVMIGNHDALPLRKAKTAKLSKEIFSLPM